MKRLFFTFLLLHISLAYVSADALGSWKIYKSYRVSELVEESAEKVYAVASGSLYSYDKEDTSIKQYYNYYDINDNNIVLIKYHKHSNSLLIIYDNGNIDILSDNKVYNLPYLHEHLLIRNKEVNSVYFYNEYAYVSAGFGIFVINMDKKEVTDTYNLGANITSCLIQDQFIYAASRDSIQKAPLTTNLLDKNNWKKEEIAIELQENDYIENIFLLKNKFYYFIKNSVTIVNDYGQKREQITSKGIYGTDGSVLIEGKNLDRTKVYEDVLAIFSLNNDMIWLFTDSNQPDIIKEKELYDISYYNKNTVFWIASGTQGVVQIEKNASGEFTKKTTPIVLDGPAVNEPYYMTYQNNKLYITSGGKTTTNQVTNSPGYLMVYEEGQWRFVDNTPINEKFSVYSKDYTKLAINPDNPDNIFVSSYGYGVIEFEDLEPINLFNARNTEEIESVGDPLTYSRIDGVSFDKNGNLWMTNAEVDNTIKIFDKNRKWHKVYLSSLGKTYAATTDDILVTSKNQKWINIPRVTQRIVIIDDVEINQISDETTKTYTTFTDQDGNSFIPEGYTAMTEDKKGYIWVGTTSGPIYFTNPGYAFSNPNNFRCTRVKLSENNELYYLLDHIRITTITIDGGNRKWFGTEGNGVYVLSDDNEQVEYHFNTTNSPLLSDNIYSIAIDDNTGDVFIGTDQGLVSYRSEAIGSKEDFSNVYAFPNPVNPDYNGLVTITGLMDNTNIKITDLNGNLIYQTKSIGGQTTWNCRNHSGNRVATGVYLVFGATENGSESMVTKIVVVK